MIEKAFKYIRAEQQRTVRPETTVNKMRAFPYYFYKKDNFQDAIKKWKYDITQTENTENVEEVNNNFDKRNEKLEVFVERYVEEEYDKKVNNNKNT